MLCSTSYSTGSTLKLVVMLLTLQHLLLLDVLSLSHSRPSLRLEDVSSNASAANCSGVNPLDPTEGKPLTKVQTHTFNNVLQNMVAARNLIS
jgi:hypothetical protein